MTREHWWNVDFDLALQPHWTHDRDRSLAALARQLELHALLAAEPDDSILVFDPPPEDFTAYLTDRGVPVPSISVLPNVRPEARFSPYGWSPQAIALRGRYDDPEPYPKLAVVRQVNGRRFGHRVETEILGSDVPLGACSTFAELEGLLAAAPECRRGWVVKTEHGNAALGNRRLRTRSLTADDSRWARSRLETGPVVVERWLPRELDLSAVFEVTASGELSTIGVHETIHTSDGGVIGALFDDQRTDLEQWRGKLETAAGSLAGELHRAGYFGPVCMDALVWRDDQTRYLRPLVDVNARRHAGEGWARLARTWGGCVYGRFYTVRRIRLPRTYADLEVALGADAWDPKLRTGALLTSPLWLDTARCRTAPLKLAVVFRASSRSEALAMDARFRARFER